MAAKKKRALAAPRACELAIDDQRFALGITDIHKARSEKYGSPRVHAELRAKGLVWRSVASVWPAL